MDKLTDIAWQTAIFGLFATAVFGATAGHAPRVAAAAFLRAVLCVVVIPFSISVYQDCLA